MLETSLRNADGVAAKNRNGCVESIDLVNDRSGSAQINFVRIGAPGESTGVRDRVRPGANKMTASSSSMTAAGSVDTLRCKRLWRKMNCRGRELGSRVQAIMKCDRIIWRGGSHVPSPRQCYQRSKCRP
jgi:hypothetical protein